MRVPLRLPGRRRKVNPDGSMTLMEHLFELRNRLFIAFLALGVGAALGFVWWAYAPFGWPTLGDLLTRPYCGLPGRLVEETGQCQLLQTTPFEPFTVRMQVGVAVGAVLTAPIWLGQLWGFVTPGLYINERRFAAVFISIASVLFAAGAVLAYVVVPKGLAFLASLGDGQFITALTAQRYIGFILIMLLAFGLCFELPLLVVMLNRIGVLPFEKLKSWQRGILFGLFALAAVATPGSDPISMLALAVSLVVLFELAVVIAWRHDKRLAKRRAADGLADLDPDEASPLDLATAPVEEPAGRPRYDDAT